MNNVTLKTPNHFELCADSIAFRAPSTSFGTIAAWIPGRFAQDSNLETLNYWIAEFFTHPQRIQIEELEVETTLPGERA